MNKESKEDILFKSKLKLLGVIINFLLFTFFSIFFLKQYWVYGLLLSTTYLLVLLIRTKRIVLTRDKLLVLFPFVPYGRNYFISLEKIKSLTYVNLAGRRLGDQSHINVHKHEKLKSSRVNLYLNSEEVSKLERAVLIMGIGFKHSRRLEDVYV